MIVLFSKRIRITLHCIISFFISIFLVSSTLISAQHIVRVPEDYSTIQSAISNSNDFDTIIINEGTYFENILLRDKTLIIGSKYLLTGDTSYISKTIIDGQNNSAVIRIDGDVGDETTISGLTIQNGDDGIFSFVKFNLIRNHILNCNDAVDYENNSGGLCRDNLIEFNNDDAIDLDSTVNILIENNILRNNGDDGIEIRLHRHTGPTAEYFIKSNQIYGNGEDGIQLIGDEELTNRILYIDNNIISTNRMAGIGSMAQMNTIENYNGSDIEERIFLTNNTIIYNNHGVTGSDNMILINNIISYNEVAGIKNIDGSSIVLYSDLWQNGNNIIDCNIDSATTIFKDPVIDGNYNLLIDSPCIDAGVSFYAIESDTIFKTSKSVLGNEIDIGAIEYDPGFLIKGPYLTYHNPQSQIMISWQLKNSTPCTLKWGLNKNDYSQSITTTENSSDSLEHIHSHIIAGLIPGLKYHYQIEENEMKHTGSFLTPPSGDTKTISSYSFGDSRSAIQSLDSITAGILQDISMDTLSQTFILHTGGWTTSGSEDDWQNEFFNRWYFNNLKLQSRLLFKGVRGSHESFFDPDASVYRKYFKYNYVNPDSGLYYSFDYGPVHISIVDQFIPYDTTSVQYSWLVSDLASTQKEWKIIAFHEPGYSDGGHPNNLDVQRIIQPLCKEHNVKLVLAGHNHYYSHNEIDSTHHLTLGGGGAPLTEPNGSGEGLIYSEKAFHFAKISIEQDELTVKIIKPNGTTIDSFTIQSNTDSSNTNSINHIDYKEDIYPNPNSGIITIDGLDLLSTDKCMVEIRSISGTALIRKEVYERKTIINMSELPPGLYICTLKNNQIHRAYRIIKL